MTFNEWWKQMKPAECDELKPYFEEAWELSAAAEREACAKVCEAMIDPVDDAWRNKRPDEAAEFDASDAGKQACANAIRRRSNAKISG